MKTNNTAKLLTLLMFTACGDFRQKKLTSGSSAPSQQAITADQLDEVSTNQGKFSQQKMLFNIGKNVVIPGLIRFDKSLTKLEKSNNVYCEIVDTQTEDQAVLDILKANLQNDWKEVMKAYHYIEAFKIGPLADKQNDGELPLSLYSWPNEINTCRVDVEVFKFSQASDYVLQTRNTTRGLDALGSLLLTADDKHNCRSDRYLRSWPSKTLPEKRADRCGYTKLVIEDLKNNGLKVLNEWTKEENNYLTEFINENDVLENINKVSNALFFIESVVKDIKLGQTTGIQSKQPSTFPEIAEHQQLPSMSIEALKENVQAFLNIFNGTTTEGLNGFGLDDYLKSLDHENIALDINKEAKEILESLNKLPKNESIQNLVKSYDKADCLESTSDNRIVEACALYKDVKGLTDILKTRLVLALGEGSAPRQSQGDMD